MALGNSSLRFLHKARATRRRNGYAAELRKLSEFCDCTILDEMLCDRFVSEVREEAIQRRILEEPDLTFKKAFDIALAAESSRQKCEVG